MEAVSAEVSISIPPIPSTHVSNSSGESQIKEGEVCHDDGDYYRDDDNTYDDEGYEDKGYYYGNGRYERKGKVSPMMSPIISLVTV